jgi:hypothetical protein
MPVRMTEFVVPTTYFRVMRWVLSWLGIPTQSSSQLLDHRFNK